MTDPLTYLREAHALAEQTAQRLNTELWWAGNPTRILVTESPAAALRRIAADRKLIDLHREVDCGEFVCDCHHCCAVCRWTEDDEAGREPAWGDVTRHVYPCPTVRLIAEGWGWTEETT